MNRATNGLALPPHHYDEPKGSFWAGTSELERFAPMHPTHDEVFEEYLAQPSLSPSHHEAKLAKSTGLLELHYDKIRRVQKDRAKAPCYVNGPTHHRQYTATVGYSGFVPNKDSNNIVGCTFQQGNRLAKELRPTFQTGTPFTIGNPSRSQSSPQLGKAWRTTTGSLSGTGGTWGGDGGALRGAGSAMARRPGSGGGRSVSSGASSRR